MSTSVIAAIVAAVLAPLLLILAQRSFRPSTHTAIKAGGDGKKHTLRNWMIELSGVIFLLGGGSVPFIVAGTNSLKPTMANALAIISLSILFMLGGMIIVANLLGDRGAQNYLGFCERERGVSRGGTLIISKALAVIAGVGLIAALILSL